VRILTAHQQDVANSSISVTLVGFPKVAGKFPFRRDSGKERNTPVYW